MSRVQHKKISPSPAPTTKNQILGIVSRGMSIVLPPRCSCCGVPTDKPKLVCAACWREITFITKPYCPITGIPFAYPPGDNIVSPQAYAQPPAYDRARAALVFSGTGRRFIHDFKYHDRTEKAQLAASWMTQAGEELLRETDFLVPVPMHWRRLLWRTFNQAAELARALHKHTAIPYAPNLLWRIRHTRPQVEMHSAQERQRNIQGAFALNPKWKSTIPKSRILLIDDVITTGATLQNCAKLLRKAKAPRINVLTLARSNTPYRMK